MARTVEVLEVISTPDGDASVKVTVTDVMNPGQELVEVRGRGFLTLTKNQLGQLNALVTTLIAEARQALP